MINLRRGLFQLSHRCLWSRQLPPWRTSPVPSMSVRGHGRLLYHQGLVVDVRGGPASSNNVVAIVQRVLILLSLETRHDPVRHSPHLWLVLLWTVVTRCVGLLMLFVVEETTSDTPCVVLGRLPTEGLDLVPYLAKSHPRPRISVRTILNWSSVEKPTHTVDGSHESCCLGTTSKDHPSPSQDFHVGVPCVSLCVCLHACTQQFTRPLTQTHLHVSQAR